jgi:hypothetical protein
VAVCNQADYYLKKKELAKHTVLYYYIITRGRGRGRDHGWEGLFDQAGFGASAAAAVI